MNYILFAGAFRDALLPFTFTRPVADIRIGITPSDRIYVKKIQHTRDVAVNLLMDLSESTNDMVVGSEHSILDLMQEATSLLSWAINIWKPWKFEDGDTLLSSSEVNQD